MNFDLNKHLNTFSKNLFLNEKTFEDVQNDYQSMASHLLLIPEEFIGLKIHDPYLLFISLFAASTCGKTCFLISPKETIESVAIYYLQVPEAITITDSDVLHYLKNSKTQNKKYELNILDFKLVIFTSGSSGTPKGVLIDFQNIYYSYLGYSEFFNISPADISLLSLPTHHVSGLMILFRSFFNGSTITTHKNSFYNIVSLVPKQLISILKNPLELKKLQECKIVLIGGQPLSQSLAQRCKDNHINIFETYGMTETCSLVLVNGEILNYRQCTLNNEGVISVGGNVLSSGYYQNKKFINFSLNEKNQYETSDLGEFLDKRIKFKQRMDLIINSGGVKIDPFLIETLLVENNIVSECIITSIPNSEFGETVALIYTIHPSYPINENEIRNFLITKLNPYYVPKHFFQVELIPTSSLKVKRSTIKALANEMYLKSIFSFDYINCDKKITTLFIHGLFGDKDELKCISHEFKNQSNLLFIDLPGHGKTFANNFSSFEDFLIKLTAFLKLFTHSFQIYGYSLGGRIALELSYRKDIEVINLYLESVGIGENSTDEKTKRIEADNKLFLKFQTNEKLLLFFRKWYSMPIFQNFEKLDNFENIIHYKSQHEVQEYIKAVSFFTAGNFRMAQEQISLLKNLTFPIRYFVGELDLKYLEIAENITRTNLDNFKLFKIANSSHSIHLHNTTGLKSAIKQALEQSQK